MTLSTDLQQSLYNSLKELGITEHEADLYITSLMAGPSPISKIAEQMKISRPNVYKLIAKLEEKGLVAINNREKYSRAFTVESPTLVLQQLRKKRDSMTTLDHTLAASMPDLLALFHQGGAPTKIKVFQGKEQWLKIFFDILDETRDPISFFGSADSFIGMISWATEKEWIKKRVKRGIHINVLLSPGPDALTLRENDKLEMRTTRLFKGEPVVPGFMLYANKVIIWQPKAPLAILMEDEYVVAMLRVVFNTLWQQAG